MAVSKESAHNAGDLGSIPGLKRSPGEGECYPLQHSGLENSSDCVRPRGRKESDSMSDLLLFIYLLQYSCASLVAQLVKNLPAMWETWVRSLGWEDPLEKGKATHSCILAWRIP